MHLQRLAATNLALARAWSPTIACDLNTQPDRRPASRTRNIPSTTIVDAVPPSTPDRSRWRIRRQPFAIGDATYIPAVDDPDNRETSAFYTTALQLPHSGSARRSSWQASYQRVDTDRTFTNGPLGVGFQPVG